MNCVYRVRPADDFTLDELSKGYLWFSRPRGFKGDSLDANVQAFFEDTEAIKRVLDEDSHTLSQDDKKEQKRILDEWYELMSHTGICCFTSTAPDDKRLTNFRKCRGGKGICIEFDKCKIEQFFNNHNNYPLYPCFHKVNYTDNPTKLETDGAYSILWKTTPYGKEYKTLKGLMHDHPRERDKLIFKILSTIDKRFESQKELRMILGGRNIPDHDPNLKGYKIYIPDDAINRILVYPGVSEKWFDRLRATAPNLKDKIVIVGK